LPTRVDVKSISFGLISGTTGDWPMTVWSMAPHCLSALALSVCEVFSAACIFASTPLSQNPEMLMLESLPGW
jgi:hypothetical protein